MIEMLKQYISDARHPSEKLNKLRECLQLTALKIIYDKNYFRNLSFTGGTALRILFDLKRFSEDLDFSLIKKSGYKFTAFCREIISGFKLYGLETEGAIRDGKNVQSAMIKFNNLLKETGLSDLAGQKLSIKLEVDSNPPQGWHIQNTLVNKLYLFNAVTFDLPSMYATKLHACFYRGFTKGRDFYDFIWYLGKKIEPNYLLLNNAILQTEAVNPGINKDNFKRFLLERIDKVDFVSAKRDVERFLEDKADLRLFDPKIMRDTINKV